MITLDDLTDASVKLQELTRDLHEKKEICDLIGVDYDGLKQLNSIAARTRVPDPVVLGVLIGILASREEWLK